MSALKTIGIALVTGISAFTTGFLANDFVDFRSDARETAQARLDSFDQTTKAVDTALSRFSKISAGDNALTPEDLDNLRASLLDFQRAALDVSYKVPSTAPDYRALEKSIITILDTAGNLSTANKNKPFVTAVENFLFLAFEFQDKAKKAQQGYFKGLWNAA